jgi:hypothetical protein
MKPKIEEILDEGKSKTTKGFSEKDADPKQVAMGMEVEKEHSSNPVIRKKITLDHIAEFPTYYTGLDKMEKSMKKQAEDMTTQNILHHNGDPKDDNSAKKNLLNVNRVIRLAMSPNKAEAIERSVIGTIANGIVNTITKMAAVEAFNDEMEKLSHTLDQVWGKIGLLDKIKLKVLNPGAKERAGKLLGQGRQIAASNSINATLGRPLIRNVHDKPAAFEPFMPQKDTYRKPGGF